GYGGEGATAGRDLKHRAGPTRAAGRGGAEEVAAAVQDQAAVGVGAIGEVEGGQRGDSAAARRHLEHRAVAVRAPRRRDPEEIATVVPDETASGIKPVRRTKGGERRQAGEPPRLERLGLQLDPPPPPLPRQATHLRWLFPEQPQ